MKDIEQLVTMGRDLEACPYYGARYALPSAQVICYTDIQTYIGFIDFLAILNYLMVVIPLVLVVILNFHIQFPVILIMLLTVLRPYLVQYHNTHYHCNEIYPPGNTQHSNA